LLEHIETPVNDFAVLAAIGPDQFLCGIMPWSRGNSRAATFSRLRPKLRANTRLSNNRDGRASTRREIGRLRVLIVVVIATTKSVWG
jgi:hypothetical protein